MGRKLKTIKGDPAKWSKTGRGLLFEVKTYAGTPGRVNVSLVLGPSDNDLRKKVYEAASLDSKLFKGLVKPMGAHWATIFSRDLLTVEQAKKLTFEQQEANVRAAWSDFQGTQLMPLINAIVALDAQLSMGETG